MHTLHSSKSVHLATVELCTSCSQKADREGLSLKSGMNFHFCWEGKKYFFYWFEWTLPPRAILTEWLLLLVVLLLIGLTIISLTKTSFNHPSVMNHLWGYNLCNALKHTLTMNRTKYRQSQST